MLILRNVKGTALTYTEMDDNLLYLEGLSGATQSDLDGVLSLGNTSGTYSIEMGTGTDIHSAFEPTNKLELDLDWDGDPSVRLGSSGFIQIASDVLLESGDGSNITLSDTVDINSSLYLGKSTQAGYISTRNTQPLNIGITALETGTVSIGNATYPTNINGNLVMATSKSIKAQTDGGELNLNAGSGIVNLFAGSSDFQLSIDPSVGINMYSVGDMVLGADAGTTINSGTININSKSSNDLFIEGNTSGAQTTSNTDKSHIFVATRNSTINAGVVNSVIVGGTGLTAGTSNTVYVPDLNIQTGKSIKTSNGSGSLQLDYLGASNTVVLGANGVTKGYLFLSDFSSGLYFNDGYTKGFSVSSIANTQQHDIFAKTKSPGTVEKVSQELASVTTTDATITTIKSYTSQTDTMISVKATINGHDLTNNIAYGSTIYAVYRNDAGVLTKTGTTDKSEKSDFTTATSDFNISGTDIQIQVVGEAAKTVKWYSNVEFTQH
jgi:hypothetical protein